MPLSEAFNPNKPPNIKDVTWTPEKKEVSNKPFDPERDISEEDWKGMVEDLNQYRQEGRWGTFSHHATVLLRLFPERRAEFQLSNTEFQGILKVLRRVEHGDTLIIYASQILTLFPDRRAELKLDEPGFEGRLGAYNKPIQDEMWTNFLCYAPELFHLFPDKREEFKLGEKEFQGMLEELNELRQSNKWDQFARFASSLLRLFPERRSELKLSGGELEGIIKNLNKYHHDSHPNWYEFSRCASELKLLLADEIKRKEDGTLDIIFNKPKTELKEETPPQPIMRNY